MPQPLTVLAGWVDWAALAPALHAGARIAGIILAAWVLHRLGQRLIRTFRGFLQHSMPGPDEERRIATLDRVTRYTATTAIVLVAGMLVLAELGVAIAPILGAAGVVGVAVGFGAQNLVKDFFNGFFMLLENQVRQGDVVEAGGKSGLVEEVTLRYLRLRDYSGNVHFIPNGLITTVTNMSREHAYAVVDVGVAYREDVDEVFETIREVAARLRTDAEFGPRILDDLELAGIEQWAESSVVIRCRVKVRPLEQWNIRRELLRRLKQAFDARGIEIPLPHLTIYPGRDKAGKGAAFAMADVAATPARRRPRA